MASTREKQRIVEMCWESYAPLVERAVRGIARPADWAQLDKLLCEDYPDHAEMALGGRPYILESLLYRMIVFVKRRGWEDQLYNALESGLWDRILDLKVLEHEYMELVRPASLEAAVERAGRVRKLLRKWISNLHDGELYHFVYEELERGIVGAVKRRHVAFYARIEKRCAVIKEELVAAAWAPVRVERWIEAGANLEDC
jgi:hypothetical protein